MILEHVFFGTYVLRTHVLHYHIVHHTLCQYFFRKYVLLCKVCACQGSHFLSNYILNFQIIPNLTFIIPVLLAYHLLYSVCIEYFISLCNVSHYLNLLHPPFQFLNYIGNCETHEFKKLNHFAIT